MKSLRFATARKHYQAYSQTYGRFTNSYKRIPCGSVLEKENEEEEVEVPEDGRDKGSIYKQNNEP